MKKNLLIIAGETSGDLHGAALIHQLNMLDSEIHITGIGGKKMQQEGMQILFDIRQMAFLGFTEVIKHIPFIRTVRKRILSEVDSKNINTAVLIDYPGFNINLAAKLKEKNVNVIYYISPQLWAWGSGRIKKIKKYIRKMLVVFPFEYDLYIKEGIDAEYVGHPLVEQIEDYKFLSRQELNSKFKLQEDKDILLILPGSRMQEVNKIFPETIAAADKLSNEFNMQVVVACSQDIDEKMFFRLTALRNFVVVKGNTYDLFKQARLGIIKSGTSTLEAGYFGLPMVVVYTTNYLTYLIGKSLIKINSIGLVNIVAGEKIVSELIQKDVNRNKIYNELKSIIGNKTSEEYIKAKLGIIKDKLGSRGASRKAAESVYSFLCS